MPRPSSRITGITPSGRDGWEVHFTAMARKQAGEDIIMLSVGDHDFDTPSQTVEACVKAVRAGFHHYTQLGMMLDIRSIEPDCEKFAWAFLDAEKVSVMPGASFGDAAKGHVRISLCQPEDILRQTAAQLRRFAASYRSKAA